MDALLGTATEGKGTKPSAITDFGQLLANLARNCILMRCENKSDEMGAEYVDLDKRRHFSFDCWSSHPKHRAESQAISCALSIM
jgi:hypothetical protein